jgi:hypothetical protein
MMADALAKLAAIPPRDRRDAEFYMSQGTYDFLCTSFIPGYDPESFAQMRMLGQPIQIDDSLPFGIIECIAELLVDRAIRRATEAGRHLVINRPVFSMPSTYVTVPTPTLRALLRHWWRKLVKQ